MGKDVGTCPRSIIKKHSNPYNAFPPNCKWNRQAVASPSFFACQFVAHIQKKKANLEEERPLLAQVRKQAADLLSDTVAVFRV